MTEHELNATFNITPTLIKHVLMRDVAFYPIGLDIETDVYRVDGIWYHIGLKGLMAHGLGFARQIISLKKEDLVHWSVFDPEAKV